MDGMFVSEEKIVERRIKIVWLSLGIQMHALL
jgi:hypothetical protein